MPDLVEETLKSTIGRSIWWLKRGTKGSSPCSHKVSSHLGGGEVKADGGQGSGSG
jgi:hypothetical protein